MTGASLVLLTVPDDAIAERGRLLADSGALPAGCVLAHCSGALSSDVLAPARKAGCAVGSVHPLQTFPSAEAGVRAFAGTYCFCEGDPDAVEAIEAFSAEIGGLPVRIAPEAKTLYHAAAVMACNHLAGLLDASLAAARGAGIDPDLYLRAIGPIVTATVGNVLAEGPAKALTGPVVRGDAKTIAGHVEALGGAAPELRNLYNAAGLWTVELARRTGAIDDLQAEALRRLHRQS